MSELVHYGIKRKSGRYPWGSGEDPYQHERSFLSRRAELIAKGYTTKQIADEFGISVNMLRAYVSLANDAIKRENANMALTLKDKGWSNVAIAERLGVTEGTVRNLLKNVQEERFNITRATADNLKQCVGEDSVIDIGAGVEHYLGISGSRLSTAVQALKEEGYNVYYINVQQVSTGKDTTIKVLAPPGMTYAEAAAQKFNISLPFGHYTEDGGRTWLGIEEPKSVDSSRVAIKYAEEGGITKDGIIELRRGVDDLSLGGAQYGQVRIAVDGTHYIKGMAIYSDDLPDGVDIRFNTNKHDTGNKLDALKKMSDDPDNPFKSTVRQHHYIDKNGETQLSALNIVASGEEENVEGRWANWSKTLSSQFLSKQSPSLAKKQLDLTYDLKEEEFEEISELTNPVVKRKMLLSFADDCDASAEHLKAAAMPRQSTKVLLPVDSLKENEVYAPTYNDGEQICLVRFPHGGIFEIPTLTVNNRNKEAKSFMANAEDAIGINHKVAEQLSGADFDGDTVIAIPTNGRTIRTKSPLKELANFDPKEKYSLPDDAPKISIEYKQKQMGIVSNLITDMTIKGAPDSEIARAVRHSMVVIDSEKHHLDYKQSAIDNGIDQLKQKYQQHTDDNKYGGASTLISRASSEVIVNQRKQFEASRDIDPETGAKTYTPTGKTTTDKKGNVVLKTEKSTQMLETRDARSLSSGTRIEEVYAEHANKLKSLANTARKEYLKTPPTLQTSSTAKETYAKEVETLKTKLVNAQKNAPLERQAQLMANSIIKSKTAGKKYSKDDLKKIKNQALAESRKRVGAGKEKVQITDNEWKAIQSGAVTATLLKGLLDNTDLDRVKQLATPRTSTGMTAGKTARAKSMLALGYTQAEVAKQLGVSVSTLTNAIK